MKRREFARGFDFDRGSQTLKRSREIGIGARRRSSQHGPSRKVRKAGLIDTVGETSTANNPVEGDVCGRRIFFVKDRPPIGRLSG